MYRDKALRRRKKEIQYSGSEIGKNEGHRYGKKTNVRSGRRGQAAGWRWGSRKGHKER